MRGVVRSVSPERGLGFIRADDGQELFFHRSALAGVDFEDLAEGVAVVFEATRNEPGDRDDERPRAVNIHLADDATPGVDNEPLPAEKTRSP